MRFHCVKVFRPKIGSCNFFDKFQVCRVYLAFLLHAYLYGKGKQLKKLLSHLKLPHCSIKQLKDQAV